MFAAGPSMRLTPDGEKVVHIFTCSDNYLHLKKTCLYVFLRKIMLLKILAVSSFYHLEK